MSRPFLVIFTARSGSTALYGNLSSHPDILMRAEVFGNAKLPGDVEQTDDNRLAFLRKFWGHYKNGGTDPNGVFRGFKYQVTRKGDQFERPMRLANVAFEYAPAIIALRRQNIIKQALSALNARRLRQASAKMLGGRELAHITPEETALLAELKKTKMVVDVDALNVMVAGVRRNYEYMDKIVDRFGDHLNITYEDYQANRDGVVRQVMEYIGVDADKWQPADTYLKITSDNLQSVVENYDDLERYAVSNGMQALL